MHTKKPLSILLTLCMIVGLLPWSVLPARATGDGTAGDPWQIGASGGDVKAVLSNGTLTIYGTGAMQDFNYASKSGNPAYIPWTEAQGTITKVIIEDGVTSIGADSFCWCTRLTSISIPKSVSSIGDRVFYFCGALDSITVDKDNESYKIEDGVLFSKNGDTLYVCPSTKTGDSYAIPKGVKTVKEYAFYYSNLKSVTIPNTVTSVETYAFQNASIESVTVESGGTGTTIANCAFDSCYNLVSASLNGATSVSNQAFDWCSKLKTVELNGAATVGKSAFSNCSAIYEITITLGEGSYAEGTDVSISADYDIPNKRAFSEWISADELVFTSGSATTADVSFIMPEGGVSLTAIFLDPSKVAEVNGTEYDDLKKAITAAGKISGGGTVKLLKDVTVSSYVSVTGYPNGIIVTLDLNNHGIIRDGYSQVINVSNSSTLTLVDNAKRKTPHYIILNSAGRATGVKMSVDDIPDGTNYLTVFGGYVSGGYMTGGSASKGAGVSAWGTVIMEGGTICGNQVEANNSDKALAYGAGVYVGPKGVFTMKGGTICGNVASMVAADSAKSASVYGAGVYVDGTFTMEGGTIRDNYALIGDRKGGAVTALGGGVYVAGSFEITGCPVVSGNKEGAENENGQFTGGVESNVYLASGKTITVTDAVDNEASIGVRTETKGVFAQAADNYNGGRLSDVSCFSSDAGYSIKLSDHGKALLGNIFTVTVTDGRGGGEYFEGTSVTITANAPASGKRFKAWSGADGLTFTEGSATSATATFTMPAQDVTVAATYEDIPAHTLSVTAPTFDAAAYGYVQPAAKPITITSTGNSDATVSGVALSGTNAASFTLNKTDGATVTAGATDNTTYTIRPASGLAVGTYTATITVTYDGGAVAADVSFTVNVAGTVAAPTFSPAAGSFVGTQSVTLSCSTDGAAIYYTTDGTTPTTGSAKYTGAISVSATTTITAIAVKDGWTNSAAASATYTVNTAPATFSVSGGFDGGKLVATVTAPKDSVLIAAAYENGKLADVKTCFITEAMDGKTHTFDDIKTGGGYTYKLMLVSESGYKPLCAAWDSTKLYN